MWDILLSVFSPWVLLSVPGIDMKRRRFLCSAGKWFTAFSVVGLQSCRDLLKEKEALEFDTEIPPELFFDISLAEWSLHKSIWSGALDHLDFCRTAREEFGIGAVEYVNQFFLNKANDISYLSEMKVRAEDNEVKSLIIMIDMEGSLGSLEENRRKQSVENHFKWIEAAHFLGCHSVRVNAAGKGNRQAVSDAVSKSLGRLCEYADNANVNVIIENHGGYSSDADWLTGVMQQVNHPRCGILPDLGNFTISLFPPVYDDPQEGIKKMMPYARGISAKTHDFNGNGQEKSIDYREMLQIIRDHGFNGYIGIEYEGYKLSEKAGILATKNLLIDSGIRTVPL
jgi:sugar phosphate isomerase/epimerase